MIRSIFQAADAVVEEVAAEMENRIKEEEVILVCLLVSPVIFFSQSEWSFTITVLMSLIRLWSLPPLSSSFK